VFGLAISSKTIVSQDDKLFGVAVATRHLVIRLMDNISSVLYLQFSHV
jgi:hypothetical protein